MKVHDAVIRLFNEEGVETLFALMSEDTMSTLSTIQEQWSEEMHVVHTRHEQGAVAMADGYSRASDDVGVCLIGRGPAVAQTGTSLVTAQRRGRSCSSSFRRCPCPTPTISRTSNRSPS